MRSWPEAPEKPIVVPRAQHGISRSQIDPDALKVLYRLHHSKQLAYLVGGSVRDLLLGKTPKDFDIGTDAHPKQVRRLFRNSRIIGRRFKLVHVYFPSGKIIEVATFRSVPDVSEAEESAPSERFNTFGTPAEDARRRDITINGLFYDIGTFSVIDYVGGLRDLRDGIVRTIKDPAESFVEDPVRIIRVMRHAARTGFEVETQTWKELMNRQRTVMACAIDRIREEFLRDLVSTKLAAVLELFHASGFLYSLFPEFEIPGAGRLPHRIDFLHHLLEAASVIDQRVAASREPPSAPMLLGIFLMPYFTTHAWRALPEKGQELTAFLRGRFAHVLDPVLRRLSFAQLTRSCVHWEIMRCEQIRQAIYRHGCIPRALQEAEHFAEGFELYRADLERRGVPMEEADVLAPGRAPARRRRRRRPRRRHHVEPPAPHVA
ncbi:MAG: poly(A) polymerase [Acidobacteriota bacterium]